MNEVITQLLQRYVELVDAITPRGALRGEELLSVGLLRQRTIEVLQTIEAAAQETSSGEQSEDKADAPKPTKAETKASK